MVGPLVIWSWHARHFLAKGNLPSLPQFIDFLSGGAVIVIVIVTSDEEPLAPGLNSAGCLSTQGSASTLQQAICLAMNNLFDSRWAS